MTGPDPNRPFAVSSAPRTRVSSRHRAPSADVAGPARRGLTRSGYIPALVGDSRFAAGA